MAFDLNRCIGCWACAVACKVENSVPEGMWWQTVHTVGGAARDTSAGVFPYVSKHYQPANCYHCADAPCIPVCPEDAIAARHDGIVAISWDACTGCGECVPACPYGAITLGPAEPVLPHGLEDGHGAVEVPVRRRSVAEKCTFCDHRVDQGLEPACVLACPTRVITFGDLDDPQSPVSVARARVDATQDQPETGADPQVWFLPASTATTQRRSGAGIRIANAAAPAGPGDGSRPREGSDQAER